MYFKILVKKKRYTTVDSKEYINTWFEFHKFFKKFKIRNEIVHCKVWYSEFKHTGDQH